MGPDATGQIDQAIIDHGMPDRGSDRGGMEIVDQDVFDALIAVDQAAVERDMADATVVDLGRVDQDVMDQLVDQTMPDQGVGCIAADETCDGLDNDCDGNADEGVLNACGACGPVPDEICDARDNDCDGRVDETFRGDRSCFEGPPELVGVGICRAGTQRCVRGELTDCRNQIRPAVDTCDRRDNDCDGRIDEGMADCCSGPDVVIRPERCDATDNDCDGRVDEGLRVLKDVCDAVDNDCDGRIDEDAERSLEICDDADNDCDGRIDEDVGALGEVCDGVDNDCDGATDEGFGVGEACVLPGACGAGNQRCAGADSTECSAIDQQQPERCDGVDEDCDGQTDEDSMDAGSECFAVMDWCRNAGAVQCAESALICVAPAADPRPEVANGTDDDCDGRIDEGMLGAVCDAACGAGRMGCLDGEAQCDAFECQPPTERCADGVDDDCDGSIDEAADVRRLPAGFVHAIVQGETIVAWGGSRIGRFTLDGRAIDMAQLDALGSIRIVEPTLDGFGIFGEDRLGLTQRLTFARLDARLSPVMGPTTWLETPTFCGPSFQWAAQVLEAVVVPDGFLAFFSDPCRAPNASLSVVQLDANGQQLGMPTVLRQQPCEAFDALLFGACPVRARRIADAVVALTNSEWGGAIDDRHFGPLGLSTVDLAGRLVDFQVMDLDQRLDIEEEWGTALAAIAETPLMLMAKSFVPANCSNLGDFLMAQTLAGASVVMDAEYFQPQPPRPGRTPRQIFVSERGESILAAWAWDGVAVVAGIDAQPPLTLAAPASVVTQLEAGETLVAFDRLEDSRLALVTLTDERLRTRIVGWPTCVGEDQDCDGIVDEGCLDDGCLPGSSWFRPGGYWHALAGHDPAHRPPVSASPGADQDFDACKRLTRAYQIARWRVQGAVRGNCDQFFDTTTLDEQFVYDADGNLIESALVSDGIHGKPRFTRHISHVHDERGLRTQTEARQDCEPLFGASPEDCELFGNRGVRVRYINDEQGRLVREETDFYTPLNNNGPDGLDRISTFTWDEDAQLIVEDVDLNVDGVPDERFVHPMPAQP